jgi:hypothetical protein
METPAQYNARILALMEGKDPIAVQRETAPKLEQWISGVPPQELAKRPAPAKWSVAEILAHLAETEVGSTWRYRQMIEHEGVILMTFDQDLWERLGEYSSRDPYSSLQLFNTLRQSNLRMFDKLTPEEWQRQGVHVERGLLTVKDMAIQIAGHDINHLAQVRKILGK